MSTTSGVPLSVYSNNNGNIILEGPFTNNGSGQNCVNMISNTLITDWDGSAGANAEYYIKATAHFILLSAILDTAPAAVSGTSGAPNITMTVNNVLPPSETQVPNTAWFVIIGLSAGGKMSSTPVFATNPTPAAQLIFILSNYFQITSPGVFYMVTVEAFAVQGGSNVLVPSSASS